MKVYLMKLWEKLTLEQRILLLAALASGLVIAIISGVNNSPSESAGNGSGASATAIDTLIPKGYVLVPIEAENYEALDSILGRFGIVDLFQGSAMENSSQKLIARDVRILRAPQNPTHFAVLVQESEVRKILQSGSVFTVVVKGPKAGGTEFVKEKRRGRKIVYEGGS